MPDLTLCGVTLECRVTRPKLIAPIMPQSPADAAAQAGALRANPDVDLVELRLDPLLAQGLPTAALADALRAAHAALAGGKPLLATVRTAREGGQAGLEPGGYAALCAALLQTHAAELLDVEFSAGKAVAAALRAQAAAAGVATVFSRHHFDGTPPVEEMAAALCCMADAGADVAKLAVMPRCPADAAALLQATALAKAQRPGTPLITMAMGAHGAVTRVCGGAFGSAATFGTVAAASAPGQPRAAALRAALAALAECL